MKKGINFLFLLSFTVLLSSCGGNRKASIVPAEKATLSVSAMQDKIKGGWAGQTIGCTYGGPTEFQFKGSMIQDYQPIVWYDDYIRELFESDPGLFDDVYMDLSFIEVLERCGLDAPADSFALSFAHAPYKLWHANQAAR